MAKEIIMPKFGFTQEESTIVRWLKQEGDVVEKGDPIAECTTDKIDMEVEAPADGILGGIRYQEGDTVPVTEIIAYILEEGEEAPAAPPPAAAAAAPQAAAPAAAATPAAAPAGAPPATPLARRVAAAEGVDLAGVTGSGPGGKITRQDVVQQRAGQAAAAAAPAGKPRATPAARRVARDEGVDLAQVAGSGPHGRVQAADVVAAAQAAAPAAALVRPALVIPSGEPLIIPLEGMRRTIATRMQASYQEAPHVNFTLDIDMTKATALREIANRRIPEGQPRISMTAIIVRAVAWTLRQYPEFNSYLHNDQIMIMPDVNVGVAVALEQGLIVPVVRHADVKGLLQIGEEIADLSRRARAGQLRPDEVTDGTFTVSNLGMFGIDHFTAVINPPQVAILAVGQIARRFVPDENDQPVIRPMMTVTLISDHRVVDGAQSAQFVAALRDSLEEPSSLLL